MSSVAFHIGNWPVYWYGILISAAFVIGLLLSQHLAKKKGYDIDALWTLFLIVIPCAVVCARLYYVIFNLDLYLSDPIKMIKVWKGGLAVHGGILGGLLAIFICCKKMKLNFPGVLDCIVPSLALGQAIGRWGNFINGEAYGGVTNLPWGIHVAGDSYLHHPTFLYESVWDFILFLVLIKLFDKTKNDGSVSCIYFMVYSFGRFFIEGLRTDSLMIGPFRQAQVISICLFAASAAAFIYINRKIDEEYEIKPQQKKNKQRKKK